MPKFILGFPTGDVISNAEIVPMPRLVKRWLFQATLWLLQGPPSRYRMPDPDYSIDQAHPTMTDEIPRLVAHDKLTVKPDVARFEGERVLFKDGTSESIARRVRHGYQLDPFMRALILRRMVGRDSTSTRCIPNMRDCSSRV